MLCSALLCYARRAQHGGHRCNESERERVAELYTIDYAALLGQDYKCDGRGDPQARRP